MASFRSAWLAILFLGAGLSGCFGAKDQTGASVKLGNVTTASTFSTPPDGRNGTISAFSETNATESGAGGLAHTHDYWKGRTRVTVVDEDVAFSPAIGTQGAVADFSVPQPYLVYEGTGTVEVTLSSPQRQACEPFLTLGAHYVCTPSTGTDPLSTGTAFSLRYEHGAASSFIDAGTLSIGKAAIIKITDPKQTDMPHATTSLWAFEIVSPNAYDNTLVVHAKVEIVRSPDANIPLWPGHPLFYTPDKHVRDVFDGNGASGAGASSATLSAKDSAPTQPQKLISYGTRSVYVWVNITDYAAQNPALAPVAWYLWHTNASGISNITSPFDVKNHSVDTKSHFWILPVNDSDMDSPYQDHSRWQFQLRGSYATPQSPAPGTLPAWRQFSCYSGCADYAVKYTLTVRASDLYETGRYQIFCEDTSNC